MGGKSSKMVEISPVSENSGSLKTHITSFTDALAAFRKEKDQYSIENLKTTKKEAIAVYKNNLKKHVGDLQSICQKLKALKDSTSILEVKEIHEFKRTQSCDLKTATEDYLMSHKFMHGAYFKDVKDLLDDTAKERAGMACDSSKLLLLGNVITEAWGIFEEQISILNESIQTIETAINTATSTVASPLVNLSLVNGCGSPDRSQKQNENNEQEKESKQPEYSVSESSSNQRGLDSRLKKGDESDNETDDEREESVSLSSNSVSVSLG